MYILWVLVALTGCGCGGFLVFGCSKLRELRISIAKIPLLSDSCSSIAVKKLSVVCIAQLHINSCVWTASSNSLLQISLVVRSFFREQFLFVLWDKTFLKYYSTHRDKAAFIKLSTDCLAVISWRIPPNKFNSFPTAESSYVICWLCFSKSCYASCERQHSSWQQLLTRRDSWFKCLTACPLYRLQCPGDVLSSHS